MYTYIYAHTHEHGRFSTCCVHVNKLESPYKYVSNTSKHTSPQLNPSLSRSLSPAGVRSLGLARSRAYSRALSLSRSLSLADSLALALSLSALSLSCSLTFFCTTKYSPPQLNMDTFLRICYGVIKISKLEIFCEESPTYTWLIF